MRENKILAAAALMVAVGLVFSITFSAAQFGKLAGVLSENAQLRLDREQMAETVIKQQAVIQALLQNQEPEVQPQPRRQRLLFAQ